MKRKKNPRESVEVAKAVGMIAAPIILMMLIVATTDEK